MAETVRYGRPRGRPPGPRPPETFRSLIDAGLWRKHRLVRDGKAVRLTTLEIICEWLVLICISPDRERSATMPQAINRSTRARAAKLLKVIEKDLKDDLDGVQLEILISPEFAKIM